jgi:hypothetical protein
VKQCWSYVLEKMGRPVGEAGRDMILHIQQGLKADGFSVPMTKLCRWFEVPRRTVYYKPVKLTPKIQERFAASIKQNDRSRTFVWV